jgi:hypothetical protein
VRGILRGENIVDPFTTQKSGIADLSQAAKLAGLQDDEENLYLATEILREG